MLTKEVTIVCCNVQPPHHTRLQVNISLRKVLALKQKAELIQKPICSCLSILSLFAGHCKSAYSDLALVIDLQYSYPFSFYITLSALSSIINYNQPTKQFLTLKHWELKNLNLKSLWALSHQIYSFFLMRMSKVTIWPFSLVLLETNTLIHVKLKLHCFRLSFEVQVGV